MENLRLKPEALVSFHKDKKNCFFYFIQAYLNIPLTVAVGYLGEFLHNKQRMKISFHRTTESDDPME